MKTSESWFARRSFHGFAEPTFGNAEHAGVPLWAAYDVDMADIVLFHHAQGLTEGVLAFAEDLRSGGHTARQ
jgi:hypothetical protein